MRLETCLVLLLVPLCLGQNETNPQRSTRTPQGHLQYDDPNGHKVSWKFYSPYTQWRPYLENAQPSEKKTEQEETVPEAKSATPQETSVPAMEKQEELQFEQAVRYQPHSMVPDHIKQLIFKMYEPQGPHVDPKVYIYHTPVEAGTEDQTRSAAEQSQSDQYEKKDDKSQESVSTQEEVVEKQSQQKYVSYEQAFEQQADNHQQVQQRTVSDTPHQQHLVQEDDSKYKKANEYLISGYQNPLLLTRKTQFGYGEYPSKEVGNIEYKKDDSDSKPAQSALPAVEPAQYTQEKEMPSLIQQLLNLQAQTPYHVIANRISYKPKKIFIPKPISEDDKGFYTYRSKVYYMRDDDENEENKSDEKPVKEDQRH